MQLSITIASSSLKPFLILSLADTEFIGLSCWLVVSGAVTPQ